jgi:predicted dehydrogenase
MSDKPVVGTGNAIPRRKFLSTTAGALGVMMVLPARVLGREGMAPSEKVNIALVALGGRGAVHARELRDHNIVAVCDVDWRTWQNSPKRKAPSVPLGVTPNVCAIDILPEFPRAKRYSDWRIMLEEQEKNLDAVVVATPEHSHAAPSIAAMKMGKHVYCEKPLARSIDETRAMVAAARQHKVITQFGIQGHSGEDVLSMVEWIRDGAIGDVKEVRIFDGLAGKAADDYSFLDHIDEKHEVPADFDWDLWLGPAPARPYNPAYGPRGYGRWRDFGGGIGGIGCHLLDGPFWALDLGMPETIQAERIGAYDPIKHSQLFPRFATLRYQFPARGAKPAVVLTWDRKAAPPLPEGWDPKENLPFAGGIIYGSKGAIVFGNSWACLPRSASTGEYKSAAIDPAYKPAQIYPLDLAKAYRRSGPELPRPFSHWVDWMDAIKAGKPAGANFDYGGALTEVNQLGDIASILAGTVLHYDAQQGRFTNNDEANRLMSPPPYRKGWTM